MSIESVVPSNRLIHGHPLLPPALNLSQHQGLFQWVGSSHQVAKVSELQLQHQSFQWIFRADFLYDGLVWSPWGQRDSQESSPATQAKSINYSEHLIWMPKHAKSGVMAWWQMETLAMKWLEGEWFSEPGGKKKQFLNTAQEKKKWKKPWKELVLWREALKLWCLPAWTCGGASH